MLVSIANDDSWRVDVPGGALSGGANVSIVSNQTGVYQCLLGGPATNVAPPPTPAASPGASPSPSRPRRLPFYASPACVKAAAAGKSLPKRADPVLEHIFTDWLDVMIDRNSPILVFQAAPVAQLDGRLLFDRAELGIPCAADERRDLLLRPDGTLTAAAIAHNRLTIVGTPGAAPPTNPLPGGLITGRSRRSTRPIRCRR